MRDYEPAPKSTSAGWLIKLEIRVCCSWCRWAKHHG